MLPQLQDRKAQIDFANQMLEILERNSTVKKFIGENAKPYPLNRIKAEFGAKSDKEAMSNQNGPASGLSEVEELARGIVGYLNVIKNEPKEYTEEYTQTDHLLNVSIAMDALDRELTEFFSNPEKDPMKLSNDFLETYGEKTLDSETVKLVTGLAQGLCSMKQTCDSLAVNTEIMAFADDEKAVDISQTDRRFSELDGQIETDSREFAEKAADMGIQEPGALDAAYNQASEDYNKALLTSENEAKQSNAQYNAAVKARPKVTRLVRSLQTEKESIDNLTASAGKLLKDYTKAKNEYDAIQAKIAAGPSIEEMEQVIEDSNASIQDYSRQISNLKNQTLGYTIISFEKSENILAGLTQAREMFSSLKDYSPQKLDELELKSRQGVELTEEEQQIVDTMHEAGALYCENCYEGTPQARQAFDSSPGKFVHEKLAKGSTLETDIATASRAVETDVELSDSVKEFVEARQNLRDAIQNKKKASNGIEEREADSKKADEINATMKRIAADYKNAVGTKLYAVASDTKKAKPTAKDINIENADKLITKALDKLPKVNEELQKNTEKLAKLNEIIDKGPVDAKKATQGLKDRLDKLEELKSIRDRVQAGVKEKTDMLSDFTLQTCAKAQKARTQDFQNSLKNCEHMLKPGDRSKNSKQYNALLDNLSAAQEKFNDSSVPKNERMKALNDLKKAATEYIAAKQKQWRPFGTAKRFARLEGARRALEFCENTTGILQNTQELSVKTYQTMLRAGTGVHVATAEGIQKTTEKLLTGKIAEVQKANQRNAQKDVQKSAENNIQIGGK